MKYIRKINAVSHWDVDKMDLYDKCFSTGDILFNELKTEKNRLSVWKFSDSSEIEGLLVAIALNRDNIQKLFYVIMDDDDLKELQVPTDENEVGIADGLKSNEILKKHVNLDKIDFWRLGYVAEYLCRLTQNDVSHGDITERNLFNLIKKYIDKGLITFDEMKPKMQKSYKEHELKYAKMK